MLRTMIAGGLLAGMCWTGCPVRAAVPAVRIKDIARINGVRSNQLVGYGLVVGLDNSGDSQQVLFTIQSVANMLREFGISSGTGKLRVRNVAAVMITAELPAFAKSGDRIDVTVSSVGDARTLQGGTLLQAPLRAANGEVYAVAQGPVSVGGFTAGGGGTSVVKNHATAGRIPRGALVERATQTDLTEDDTLVLALERQDFTTASRVASAINDRLGAGTASARDAGTVVVRVSSSEPSGLVGLISTIEDLTVTPDATARVVVNERTGTVVIGGSVRISSAAVSHGNLIVEISTQYLVSQPGRLSAGETAVVPDASVDASEEKASLVTLEGTSTIEDLVAALNALKVTPRDTIAILQAIKQAGALHAELEII